MIALTTYDTLKEITEALRGGNGTVTANTSEYQASITL